MVTKTSRQATRVFPALRQSEGDGVIIHRAFPTQQESEIDPFLLLDHMGPTTYGPGQARGFPDHPHRGFETVTYLLEGAMEHRDSAGNHGVLRPGDVQWMTAGSGLVHSEMPGEELRKNGGRLSGFQLWVNLPKRDKMAPPRYQELSSAKIPVASENGVQVKVIAGEALGVHAKIETHTPISFLHFRLEPGAHVAQPVPIERKAFAYVIEGEGLFGGSRAGEREVVLFDRSSDTVEIENTGSVPLSFLLIDGQPIGEPVARYGPFVMNTREELYQAFEDFRSGRMGRIG